MNEYLNDPKLSSFLTKIYVTMCGGIATMIMTSLFVAWLNVTLETLLPLMIFGLVGEIVSLGIIIFLKASQNESQHIREIAFVTLCACTGLTISPTIDRAFEIAPTAIPTALVISLSMMACSVYFALTQPREVVY